ncbi:MAG: FprA family A-type flavoprotein [Thermoanaerobaculia bacterium]
MITNREMGTSIQEIADGTYRINTPVEIPGGAFSFNQYLVRDEQPLLFHTGPRKLFPLVREAVASVLPPESIRWIAFSHVEADECGSLNEWLATAPEAAPLCSGIAAMVSIGDLADREPRPMTDGETLSTGRRTFRWFDAPHLPHGWDCGYLGDESTRTLFCGDLFTQPGKGEIASTEADILGPSEAMRQQLDYYSHSRNARDLIDKLAAFEPSTLACMHGSAWKGDGAALLRELGQALGV